MIRPSAHIATMAPYALAKMAVPEGKTLVSLSQNESMRPPSPQVAEAVARALTSAQLYPDPDWNALRRTLADLHGVAPDDILCANGSMELILCLALCFAGPDRSVLIPAHAYPFFRTVTQLAGARLDTAPEEPAGVSVGALLDAVTSDTGVIFVANPGNPTGTRLSRAALLQLREELRPQVLLVIDEAYGEFADHFAEPLFDLTDRENTVILRSFSKAYGLAGLRVGWGVAPSAIAREIRKVMNPNTVSVAGQAAAEAAARDQSYMRETCRLTAEIRDRFIARLRDAEFSVPDSFTNFALIRLHSVEQAQRAEAALRSEGIVARGQAGAGLPACLRITVGAHHTMVLTAEILKDWAKGDPA